MVNGVVLDPDGKPMAGVRVREEYLYSSPNPDEFLTDAEGRFLRWYLPNLQRTFTAYPTNYAITSAIADIGTNSLELRIQAQPLQTLRVNVLNENGNPAPNVKVAGYRDYTGAPFLDFNGITTAEGFLIWSNAPLTSFKLQIGDYPSGLSCLVRVLENQREVTCRLHPSNSPKITVRGHARDIDSGQPVSVESIGMQIQQEEDFKGQKRINESDFTVTIEIGKGIGRNGHQSYRLQLQAKGYDPLITDWRRDEGDWDSVFLMRKGGSRTGHVVFGRWQPC